MGSASTKEDDLLFSCGLLADEQCCWSVSPGCCAGLKCDKAQGGAWEAFGGGDPGLQEGVSQPQDCGVPAARGAV